MIESLDQTTILYIFALLFGVLSVLYFARDILTSLSVTTKSYTIFLTSVVLFSSSVVVSNQPITIILAVLSGFSYLSGIGYVWKRFPLSRNLRFLSLLSSSIIFIGIAMLTQNVTLSNHSLVLLGVVSIGIGVFLLLSLFDVRESDMIEYTVRTSSEVSTDDRINVGELSIHNNGFFRRDFDVPKFKGVYKDGDKEVDVRVTVDGSSVGTVGSNSSWSADIYADFIPLRDPRHNKDFNIPETVSVECDYDDINSDEPLKIRFN